MRRRLPILFCFFVLMMMGCAPPISMKVMVNMTPEHQEYFRHKILKPFEQKNNCRITLLSYARPADLPDLIAGMDSTGPMDLVHIPLEMNRNLVGRNLITPLDEIVPATQVDALKAEYFFMDMAKIEGRYHYIPRQLETKVLMYLKSRVAEAVRHWEADKVQVESLLKKYNGYGLPKGYQLEANPSDWDLFDLAVVGHYWKNRTIKGGLHARMALEEEQSARGLFDMSFMTGASSENILHMANDAIVDMFMWKSFMTREGLVSSGPTGKDSAAFHKDPWRKFRNGEIYLAEITQADAFFLHGMGTKEAPGVLSNPEDMGLATMPQGGSLQLDEGGRPLREGKRTVSTGSWWWGIPRNSQAKKMAYRLAGHLSSTRVQIEECAAIGMMPVRKDLMGDMGLLFGRGWMGEVFQTTSKQIIENRYTVLPLVDEYVDVGRNYLDAYNEICLSPGMANAGFDRIKSLIEDKYVLRQKQILRHNYPERKLSAQVDFETSQNPNPY